MLGHENWKHITGLLFSKFGDEVLVLCGFGFFRMGGIMPILQKTCYFEILFLIILYKQNRLIKLQKDLFLILNNLVVTS